MTMASPTQSFSPHLWAQELYLSSSRGHQFVVSCGEVEAFGSVAALCACGAFHPNFSLQVDSFSSVSLLQVWQETSRPAPGLQLGLSA